VKIPTGGKAHEPLRQIRLNSEADSQSLDERRQEPFIEWHATFICHTKNVFAPSVHESERQSLGVVYAQGFLALFSWPSFVEP